MSNKVPPYRPGQYGPEAPTRPLNEIPPWAVKLAEGMQEIKISIETLSGKVSSVEERTGALEQRQTTSSERVKGESQVNKDQDSAIATILTEQRAIKLSLAANTDVTKEVKDAVSGFLKEHPAILQAIAVLITTAITAATAWFAARGAHG